MLKTRFSGIILGVSMFFGSFLIVQAAPVLTITSPNGGENLTVGSTYHITWTSSNVDTVSIAYSDVYGQINWIATNIANTGLYDWTVNVGNTTNTQFKIYIIGYQTGVGSVSDYSDNYFNVLSVVSNPVITLFGNKDPNPTNHSVAITWQASGATDAQLNVICTPGTIGFTTDKGNSPTCDKGGVWTWSNQTGDTITLSPVGNSQNVAVSFNLILTKGGVPTGSASKISVTFPASSVTQSSFTIVTPTAGSVLYQGSAYKFVWSGSDPGVTQYSVYLAGGTLSNAQTRYLGILDTAQQDWFTFNVPTDVTPGSGFVLQFNGKNLTGTNSQAFSIAAAQTNAPVPTVSSVEVKINGSDFPNIKYGDAVIVTWTSSGADYCNGWMSGLVDPSTNTFWPSNTENLSPSGSKTLTNMNAPGGYLGTMTCYTAKGGSSKTGSITITSSGAQVPIVTPSPTPVPTTSTNSTIQTILDQIKALQAQINSLQSSQAGNAMPNSGSSANTNSGNENTLVSACLTLSNNLTYRSRDAQTGGDVSALQDYLQAKGYLKAEPTGFLGILTLQAVRDFQQANGVSPTGFVGPLTRAKIRVNGHLSSLKWPFYVTL